MSCDQSYNRTRCHVIVAVLFYVYMENASEFQNTIELLTPHLCIY